MSVWNFTIYKSSRQAFFISWILEERSQDDWAKQTIRRNEERIIEIEIERFRPFKEHPFQVKDDNNTNLSDTEMNDNKSNHIISVDEKRFDSDNRSEDYQAYENLVKETIDYESLEVTHHDDMRQVDEIVNLIVETVRCKNDKILIASN